MGKREVRQIRQAVRRLGGQRRGSPRADAGPVVVAHPPHHVPVTGEDQVFPVSVLHEPRSTTVVPSQTVPARALRQPVTPRRVWDLGGGGGGAAGGDGEVDREDGDAGAERGG